MAEARLDLISMADIARLAGQSRPTVGNWKARNPDFPAERGRGARGPLYDRAEVTEWLEATQRLDVRPPEVAAVWRLVDLLRGEMPTEDALPLILLLLALMAKSDPEEWRTIVVAEPTRLGEVVRARVDSRFPYAMEVLPRGQLPVEAISRIVSALTSFDRPRLSLMADALLEQAAKAMGNRGGEYLSPPSVRKLVVALAEPTGSIYNPASGVGQLMIDVALDGGTAASPILGQEINARVWAMAQLNLAIHGIAGDIALGDVFGEDRYPQVRADRVVAVPPWNQRLMIADRLVDDARWVWGEPGPNDGNAAWIQHCLYHLADGGRAVLVLPNGALFESGRSGRIRQRIVKAGLLDAVVSLPPGLFPWTALPCSVLVFVKGRQDVDGKPAPTLMLDLSDVAQGQGNRNASLTDDLVADVAGMYRGWRRGSAPAGPNVAIATFDELAANEFIIDPTRYRSLPDTSPDLHQAEERREALINQLSTLTTASRKADEQLRGILEGRK